MIETALRLLAFVIIVVSGACSSAGTTDRTEVVDLGDLPGVTSATDWTLVVVDGEVGRTIIHNQDRAASRFPPASTFKIPNASARVGLPELGGLVLSENRAANRSRPSAGWN